MVRPFDIASLSVMMGWGVVILCSTTTPVLARQTPDTTAAEVSLEAALEAALDESGDATSLAEWLETLRDAPLDVNRASQADLAQLPAFGPLIARDIIRYRDQHGPFGRLEDLEAIASITPDVLAAARPFLSVVPPSPARSRFLNALGPARLELTTRITRRLETGSGYEADTSRVTYAGSPERIYTRLQARTARHLAAGLVLEKDPGEVFAWAPGERQYGFDHTAGYVAVEDLGRLHTLVVGDYVAAYGQGLALWRSSGFGKGREPIRPLLRTGRGVLPFASTEENQFFRGLAATLRLAGPLTLSGFASRRRLDARLSTQAIATEAAFEERTEASALSQTGLHRTPTERIQRDAVREKVVGGALEFAGLTSRLGVAGYHSRFGQPFQPGTAPYQRFDFVGRRMTMVSAFGTYSRRLFHLFGEAAHGSNGATGAIGGVQLRPASQTGLLLLARHYPRDFVSLHGFGFGERSGATQNETGYYLGLETRLARAWRLAAYYDYYRFPWIRFGMPRPGTGYEALLLLEYHPRSWLNIYLQGRTETKDAGAVHLSPSGYLLDAVVPETRQSLRLHGDYVFSRALRLRARMELVRFAATDLPDAYGLLLYQDVRWHPAPAWQVDARIAFFDTDSYDTRVFAYEQDLLYTFAVPSFSGQGQRGYLVVRWAPRTSLLVQLKASVTHFEDVAQVGSGLETVEGSRLREVRALIRLRR